MILYSALVQNTFFLKQRVNDPLGVFRTSSVRLFVCVQIIASVQFVKSQGVNNNNNNKRVC